MNAMTDVKKFAGEPAAPDLETTRKFVKESVAKAAKAAWPPLEPLARTSVSVPYPSEALPAVLLAAVREVQSFTKAPEAMVACSALATLSLAAQAHYDVSRAERLTGPVSLYFLVIAESGERKSTCDGLLSRVLHDYETQQQHDARVEVKRYEADHSAWEAIRSGILESIKQAAKSAKDTSQSELALRRHEEMKPAPPRVPRLIYSDFTPEALTYSLSTKWPSGAVISSEAGSVFGSHGMGKDSQLRTLANLNQLWDASKLTFDRRGESYVVDGARLTMSLQVQESALMDFIGRTGTLARGTGFLARFLIARPQSTQGTRLFTEPPANMPALAQFHARILGILEAPVPINERGGLEPQMLVLAPEAKAAWVRFHDEIERGLGKGGELQDVRDVASKIADNAARLAALFHVIDAGIGAISSEHFESASIVTAWHLNEALRFFGELSLPDGLANAGMLEDWLLNYCKTNATDTVSTRTVAQYGPARLRDKASLTAAVDELIGHGRAVLITAGRKREIQINPQLLEA
jgi:putative DNA primase/helicase